MASMNGTIKRLVSDKGFGFILAGDGAEYFFHSSACQQTAFDDLREGQAVTFEKGGQSQIVTLKTVPFASKLGYTK